MVHFVMPAARLDAPAPPLSPPVAPPAPEAPPAAQAAAGPAARRHGWLYRARGGAGQERGVVHRRHRHIDAQGQARVAAIDAAFHAGRTADAVGAAAQAIDALLALPCFEPRDRQQAIDDVNRMIDACPLNPDAEVAREHAHNIAGWIVKTDRAAPRLPDALPGLPSHVQRSMSFLKGNRADRHAFQQFVLQADTEVGARRSAQKMALESFQQAFPLLLGRPDAAAGALKRLIDAAPHLEHHPIAERNAERRGLRTLEQCMNLLPAEQRAEVLAHLMNAAATLGKEPSKLHLGQALGAPARMAFLAGPVAAASLAPLGLLALIPLGVMAAVAPPHLYLQMSRQAQGSALYLIKRQLESLRKDWAGVGAERRQALCEAYQALCGNVERFGPVRGTTTRRFFNDADLDPHRFGAAQGATRHRRALLAPVLTRTRAAQSRPPAPAGSAPPADEARTALAPDRAGLRLLLQSYHADAVKAGVCAAPFPPGLIANLDACLPAADFPGAAGELLACLRRVRELPEYGNEHARPKLLAQLAEMTDRLAAGDEGFVRRFAAAARRLSQDGAADARVTLRGLHDEILADKARKGEQGLGELGNLLHEGRQLFIEDVLTRAATAWMERALLFDRRNHEPHLRAAIEIALGGRLGLRDPVRGMKHPEKARQLAPAALALIETRVRRALEKEGALAEFLVKWPPLIEQIAQDPAFERQVRESAAAPSSAQADAQALRNGLLRAHIDAGLARYPALQKAGPLAWSTELPEGAAGASAPSLPPGGIDPALWQSFEDAMQALPHVAPGESTAARSTASETMRQQFAPPSPAAARRPIGAADLPAVAEDNAGGGDCLFHALGVAPAAIPDVRNDLLTALLSRDDDPRARARNAHQVAGALSQTPGLAHRALDLAAGVHEVPNEVYGRLISIPGVYAGEDELTLFSMRADQQDRTFLVVDSAGYLFRIRNGAREDVAYGAEDRDQALARELARADLALYKTAAHWQRLQPHAGQAAQAGPSSAH